MSFAAKIWGAFAASIHNTRPGVIDMASVTKMPAKGQAEKGSSLWLYEVISETTAPRVEVVTLTPELAKTLLDINPSNRSIRKTKVAQYSADMAAGRWALNGEPIIIATDGHLNDGQHRCLAVIDANTPIDTLIIFGIERDTRLTVDQGGARGASDYLSIEGVPNASLAGAIARMVLGYEAGQGRSLFLAKDATSAQIRERVHNDPAIAASATFATVNANYSRNFAAGSIIGFAHYVLARIDRNDAEIFLSRVCRGDGLRMKDPAHTVREKLIAGKLPRDRKVKLILQAWNFHRRGMKVASGSLNSEPPLPALL